MKQFIINIFVLLCLSLIIWSVTNYSYQKKFDSLEVEKKQPVLTLSDASFISKRDKELESVIKSLLYFSAKTKKLSANQWVVTIELSGAIDSAADAADLKLVIPENLITSDLKVGPSFPLFPRKVIDGNHILVTGLASPNNNEMVYGKSNKIFVEFTVSASDNNQVGKKQITISQEDTKIYLNGESVLNIDKSVKLIELL